MNFLIITILNIKKDLCGVTSYIEGLQEGFYESGMSAQIVAPVGSAGRFRFYLNRYLHAFNGDFRYLCILVAYIIELKQCMQRSTSEDKILLAQDVISLGAALWSRPAKKVYLVCHFYTLPWREFVLAGYLKEGGLGEALLRRYILFLFRNNRVGFICVSLAAKNTLRTALGDSILERTRIVVPGIPFSSSNNSTLEQRQTRGPVFLNAGEVCTRKNQELQIELADAYKSNGLPALFILAGPVGDGYRSFFMERIKRAGLLEYFVLTGPLSRESLLLEYSRSTLYIHTSRSESFGMVLIEAMSRGLPVLSLENQASREIFRGNPEAILAPDLCGREIFERVQELLYNPIRLKELQNKQSDIFRNNFTREIMIDSLMQYFQSEQV